MCSEPTNVLWQTQLNVSGTFFTASATSAVCFNLSPILCAGLPRQRRGEKYYRDRTPILARPSRKLVEQPRSHPEQSTRQHGLPRSGHSLPDGKLGQCATLHSPSAAYAPADHMRWLSRLKGEDGLLTLSSANCAGTSTNTMAIP